MPELVNGRHTTIRSVGGTVALDVLPLDGLLGGTGVSVQTLRTWANSMAYSVDSITRDEDETLQSAEITWPDGSPGILTVTEIVDYAPTRVQITHVASGRTVELTAPQEAA